MIGIGSRMPFRGKAPPSFRHVNSTTMVRTPTLAPDSMCVTEVVYWLAPSTGCKPLTQLAWGHSLVERIASATDSI